MKMRYSTILIDWDDTLWDFKANSHKALEILFERESLGKFFASFEEFYTLYIGVNHKLWEQYNLGDITKDFLNVERFHYPLRVVGNDDIDLARDLGPKYLELTTRQSILVDGAREVVEELSKRYRLVIISNGFTEVQYTKIKGSGLGDYFTEIVLSEQVGFQKPDKRFFEYTLRTVGVEASECLVVGDNFQADILGAHGAQIDSIYYNPEGRDYEKCNSVQKTITHLKELLFEL